MAHFLFLLVVAIGLGPLSPGGGQETDVEASFFTGPGYRYAMGEGFSPDSEGLIRAIVLWPDEQDAQAKVLSQLGPSARVEHHYNRLVQGLALRLTVEDLARLRAQNGVWTVYPDRSLEAALDDSVPAVGAPQVWELKDSLGQPVTGQGIRVAVLDTGIDYRHPALGGCFGAGCRVVGGFDYVHGDSDPLDDHGHGTHVAGVVAADGRLKGVAPGASLLAYKVLDERGVGYSSDVIAALEQALKDGADVVNLSLGAPAAGEDPVSRAAQSAIEKGCVVVAAAGNRGPASSTVDAPAVVSEVIAVGSAHKDGSPADSSSRGPAPTSFALKPDLIAPGVQVSSTVPFSGPASAPDGWMPASGTSVATPHVAGGAALLRQLHPAWTPLQVRAALMNYALDTGGDLFVYGAGRMDLGSSAIPLLLATPGSLSYGLPMLDGTRVLTLTLRSFYTATLPVTPTLDLAWTSDGVGQAIAPPQPVAYARVEPAHLTVPPLGRQVLTVTLDLPLNARDGYYQGRVDLLLGEGERSPSVPLAFALLSRVSVHVLDAGGQEISGWGHMAVLARATEDDWVVGNVPLKLPAAFTVPAGDYHAQALGYFGVYDHLLIPGWPPQTPYAAIQPVRIEPHTVQSVTLDLADTRTYWLDATDPDGEPAFINAWNASFRYEEGEMEWSTRLGQSYVRVLSTDLPDHWPSGFPLRLSDTPEGVSFHLALQAVGFSPLYRDYVLRHGPAWPAGTNGRKGFPLVGSADRTSLLAWERPALAASTAPTFTVSAGEVASYAIRMDAPGPLAASGTGWQASAEGWLDPRTGAGSGLEEVAPGVTRTLKVAGAQHLAHRVEDAGGARVFHIPFYIPDWSQSTPWDQDPNVLFPAERALQPSVLHRDRLTLGSGPVFPAASFRNGSDTIQLLHPLLAGATGSQLTWTTAVPTYTLAGGGSPTVSGTLPESLWVPAPLRRWPDRAKGYHELAVDTGSGLLRSGFTLRTSPSADMNPPRVMEVDLPQRYEPGEPLTVTWILSDANPIDLTAQVRFREAPEAALPVEPVEPGRFQARIEPSGAPTFTLSYTATDSAGNWLAWQPLDRATAHAQVPVSLTFELVPAGLPWSEGPVTVRILGALRGPGSEPLADAPAWLHLRAGEDFVGYVHDLSGSHGDYYTGVIDFDWTFVPAQLLPEPGSLPVSLEFDAGLFAPQRMTRILELRSAIYLPLVFKGGGP